jgi:lipid-A-disaccharide synthase
LLDALPAERSVPPREPDPTAPRVALLPGSRSSVIRRHLPWMLAVLGRVRGALPGLSVALPHGRGESAELLRSLLGRAGDPSWVELELGELHASLARCDAALSVSGTVLLDLLHHRLPTVVVYRLASRAELALGQALFTVPHFASVNLLAGAAVLPEFAFAGRGPLDDAAASVLRALTDADWRAECRAGLERAARRLGPPGASRRAALAVLEVCARRARGEPGRGE